MDKKWRKNGEKMEKKWRKNGEKYKKNKKKTIFNRAILSNNFDKLAVLPFV